MKSLDALYTALSVFFIKDRVLKKTIKKAIKKINKIAVITIRQIKIQVSIFIMTVNIAKLT
jgi:hypothetical protein